MKVKESRLRNEKASKIKAATWTAAEAKLFVETILATWGKKNRTKLTHGQQAWFEADGKSVLDKKGKPLFHHVFNSSPYPPPTPLSPKEKKF